MVRWPDPRRTPDVVRANLELFARTSAAKQLDEDPHVWSFEAYTWSQAPPMRLDLRNEQSRVIEFIMEEDGGWRLAPVEEEMHVEVQPEA